MHIKLAVPTDNILKIYNRISRVPSIAKLTDQLAAEYLMEVYKRWVDVNKFHIPTALPASKVGTTVFAGKSVTHFQLHQDGALLDSEWTEGMAKFIKYLEDA